MDINELSPEDAKASLGISTNLIDRLMMADAPQSNMETEQEMGGMQEKPEKNSEETVDKAGIEQIIKQTIQQELGTIKRELEAVLEEESNEENNGEQQED